MAADRSAAQHWLAIEALVELARTLQITLPEEIMDLRQRTPEEIYFSYGALSEYRTLIQAFGRDYFLCFGKDPSGGAGFLRQPYFSPLLKQIRAALQHKRHLLLVENLGVPVPLDVLAFTTGKRPSVLPNNRWVISTTSKDVCETSRLTGGAPDYYTTHYRLSAEYYGAPAPFEDLDQLDWAKLIQEAIRDAAGSIHSTLQQKGRDFEFWLHVALHCLYYAVLYHPRKASSNSSVSCDELVRCWLAEDLLSSATNPFDTLAATGKEQMSNSYRSEFEDGKVVIQALQEYSLLPNYSVPNTPASSSSGTATTSSHDAIITGVSKIAEGVPQLQQDELVDHGKSSRLGWVSFMNDDGRHLETLSPLPSTYIEEAAQLAHLGNLQTLDMNGVPLLEITQQDGNNKSNLHFLDLSGSRITTLPPAFFHSMSSTLEELILGNCSNLEELPPSMTELSNLLVLHVEGTQIASFPEGMFQAMQRLHTLRLIRNVLLISLPRSLSKAKGLKELHIYNSTVLSLQFLWELLPCLEDLNIQTWKSLEEIKIQGHPNLRTFSLSGPWVRYLSLRGCNMLKSVIFSEDHTDLEEVDLSGTAIEEVPHNLPNSPQLRMLLLLNVPCFKRFPWHHLVRFPKVFYLDYYGDNQISKMFCKKEICANENQCIWKNMNITQINISDSRMFYSFSFHAANKLVKEGQFIKRFNVQVKPCRMRGMEQKKKEDEIYTDIHRQSPYPDVHPFEADSTVRMMELIPNGRHVEISASNRYPDGLRHLLSVAQSIFIMDDRFIRCLTELNHIMMSLEECQLMHCHEMKVVFEMHSEGTGAIEYFRDEQTRMPKELPRLKILQVSNLNKLLCLVEPNHPAYSKLITLKLIRHIHLEDCPRLEKIFPCCLSLPTLETLVILLCCNLKKIFYKQPDYEVAPSPLPSIKRIYLQEQPQLQQFHDDVMFELEIPKFEKLFVRGCQSFHRLPLLKKDNLKSKVEVSGERDWWGRLQWSLPEQSDYYMHVSPPEFVSCKKHIIRSYLM
ncbi:unnamed protein product [Urochloa decumbens]|uniref:Disease resistance protein At4g27190-like leucine-rich repeats domain-containing protein n=1 Tax=Urochloa decumbens TaxID=240449 RepID=A0ABC9AM39_9POAL